MSKQLGNNAASLTTDGLVMVIKSKLDQEGLAYHHVSSFNEFINKGIKQIIRDLFEVKFSMKNERENTAEDQSIATLEYNVKFTDVNLKRPIADIYATAGTERLLPATARSRNLSYTAGLFVDAEITARAFLKTSEVPVERKVVVKDHQIATIPIMVGSDLCHTKDMSSRISLLNNGEDPLDPGGHFILGGVEWVVDNIESITFNKLRAFLNVGHLNEIARGEFISKPGDAFENSRQIKLFYLNNGQFSCELTAKYFDQLGKFPFFVIFRLFGMTTDKQIIDNIVGGYDSAISVHMIHILSRAMKTVAPQFADIVEERDPTQLRKIMAEKLSVASLKGYTGSTDNRTETLSNRILYLTKNLLPHLDVYLLPHIGLDKNSRMTKLRFLGYLIYKVLLVEQRILPSTNRDSFFHKRIHSAGLAMSKTFKSQFNNAVVREIDRNARKDFKSITFSNIPLAQTFKSSTSSRDLEKAMEQAITTGNKTMVIKSMTTRVPMHTQALHRKNDGNTKATLRTVRTPNTSSSKATARATDMRKFHSSYIGYLCPAYSPHTGETVGLIKQLTISASITPASDSISLKNILLNDDILYPLDTKSVFDIYNEELARVFVNGDWIGCTDKSHILVGKYRELRRNAHRSEGLGINALTTIVWNTQENAVYFWVDAGRIVRPLLVVKNNWDFPDEFPHPFDYKKASGFIQDVVITAEHMKGLYSGEINIETLHAEGVIDYINAEEHSNCLVAENLDELKKKREDFRYTYTHCEIPVATIGLTALTSVLCERNAIVRIVYQISQANQTCGWATLNFPHRFDKEQVVQYRNETPLVKTITSDYIYPNGTNVILAIMCYDGYNMEDSKIMKKSAIDRGMFVVGYYSYMSTECEKNERFGRPDWTKTMGRKPRASYELLDENGVVPIGTMIHNGDVIIGKQEILTKTIDEYTQKDRSVVYSYDEPAIVEDIVKSQNQDQKWFITVKYKYRREPDIGDKFSSRAGQKGVIGTIYPQSDMPFTESGITPDVIMNVHAIPSRMTIGQLVEGVLSKKLAIEGSIGDGTIFRKLEVEEVCDELENLGFNRYGRERMYNGMTGECMNVEIFITPVYYQRLKKFVLDDVYAMSQGRTEAFTRQYMEGKANAGGSKLGEMEKDCVLAHGAVQTLMRKFLEDSDLFYIYVCQICGKRAIVNEAKNKFECKICMDEAVIVKVKTSWSSNIFLNEIEAMNIGIKLTTRKFAYEVMD